MKTSKSRRDGFRHSLGLWWVGVPALLISVGGCVTVQSPEPEPTVTPSGNVLAFEYASKLAECLQAAGWNVEVTDTGGWGVEIGIPEDQAEAYRASNEACSEQVGLADLTLTPELAAYNYENNVRVSSCLEDLGWSTPTPPSRGGYISKVLEDAEAIVWDPYELVPPGDLARAATRCPQ